jgi:hypothetical protein
MSVKDNEHSSKVITYLKLARGEEADLYIRNNVGVYCDGHHAGTRTTMTVRGPATISILKKKTEA